MITALINWLGVYENPGLSVDLLRGRLDRLDGLDTRRPSTRGFAA